MQHAERNYLSRTDAEGRFRIRGVPGFKTDLWLSASGSGPGLLAAVVFPESSSDLGEISLPPGGSLDLELDVPADFPRNEYLLGLRSVSASDPSFRTRSQEVWLRPLSGGGPVSYESLPAGDFEVWLKPRLGSKPGLAPLTVARARVEPARKTTLAAVVPMLGRADLKGAGREVRLLISSVPSAQADSLRLLSWKDETLESFDPGVQVVSGGLLARAVAPCRPEAAYLLVSEKHISEPVASSRDCTALEGSPGVHPRAELKGQIRVPAGTPRPKLARVEVTRCGGPGSRRLGDFPAVVDPEGRWTAAVPAGCGNLTLAADGFAPVPWRGLTLQPGETRDLGEQRLQPGAALLARVLSGKDGLPMAGVQVEVVPESEIDSAVYASFSGSGVVPLVRQVTDAQGWVRFSTLPAGAFYLRAVPPQGLPTFSEPFATRRGEETVLADLVLPQPASVEVKVSGPLSGLPEGSTLTVEAAGDESCGWRANAVMRAGVDPAQTAGFPTMHPGPWVFRLLLQDAAGRSYEVSRRREDVPAGGVTSLELPLGRHLFRGEVTSLDQPVQAELRLRSRKQDDFQRLVAHTASGADGTFSVFLEEPGLYDVEALLPDRTRSWISRVAFEETEEPVHLQLPEGGLEGTVTDEQGQPVAGAGVYARRRVQEGERPADAMATSDPQGFFRLERLEPGEWALEARQESRKSETVKTSLAPSEMRTGVSLVLAAGATLEGRVLVAGQPVAGITGFAWCLWKSIQDPCGGFFTTGPQGDFSLPLGPAPPQAPVNLILEAPGLPLTSLRLALTGEPLTVSLPPSGGRVRVVGDRGMLGARGARLILIHDQGGMVSLDYGRLGGEADPAERLFPSLAPGSWSVALLSSAADRFPLSTTEGGGLSILTTFGVQAGGRVEVALPGGLTAEPLSLSEKKMRQ